MELDNGPRIGDSYCILSRYGQKFNLNQVMNNEIDKLTSERRLKLKEDGYDVDSYDEQFNALSKELSDELNLVDNIKKREKITLRYNEKKNMLAKKYLGIDLNLKVKVK